MTDDPLDAMKARWNHIQGYLFPWLREEVEPMTEALGRLVTTLDVIGLEAFVPEPPRGAGRPPDDRRALARAFVAKAVLGVPTTTALIERLDVDKSLRRILGWERRSQVPSEATFSRAFAEFARGELPDKIHAALIERALGGRITSGRSRATPPRSKRARSRSRTRPTTAKTIRRRPIIPRRRASADVHARTNRGRSRSRRVSSGRSCRTSARCSPTCPPPATSAARKTARATKRPGPGTNSTSTWPAAKSRSPAC